VCLFVSVSMMLQSFTIFGQCVAPRRHPCVPRNGDKPPSIFGYELPHDPVWFEPDVNDLKKQLRSTYKHPSNMAEMAANAQHHVRSSFNWIDISKAAYNRLRRTVSQRTVKQTRNNFKHPDVKSGR
jgi:hypothetical protein